MRKILMMALAALFLVCSFSLIACENGNTSAHNFSSAYEFDESMHWQECADEGCTEKNNLKEHSYQLTGTTNTCSVCGYSFNTANTFEVNLETLGRTVLSGVKVDLYDKSNQVVASGKTNVRGKVRFSEITPDNYVAKIDESSLPKGYYVPEELKNIELSKDQMKITAKIPSALITEEDMPAGQKYPIGQVVYDFKTTSIDMNGKEKNISLSAYLSQFKAVIINFWYIDCPYCIAEFPHMNEAYLSYSDKVAIIALNSGVDTSSEIADFVASSSYKFDFVNDDKIFAPLKNAFIREDAFPTTFVIDRYGAVAHIEQGAITNRSDWENLFDYYIADDYVPDYVRGYSDSYTPTDSQLAKPDVEMPSSAEIAEKVTKINSLTKADTFTYSNTDNEKDLEYSWPWVIDEIDGVPCIRTSNRERVGSYSILLIEVEMKKGQQLFFDYYLATEKDADILYVQVDTVLQQTLSGDENKWTNDQLLYVALRDGKYKITLTYQKNTTNSTKKDAVYVKNFRIEDGANVSGHHDLLYNAADNYTLTNATAPIASEKGYINYVASYKNADEDFYRVALSGDVTQKSANDPILYADLYYTTPWNDNFSVWNLAYSGTGLFSEIKKEHEGYVKAVEDYSWIQNNNVTRYVPVTEELRQILIDTVANIGRKIDPDDDVADEIEKAEKQLDKQWLEVCRYYVHFGVDSGENDDCFALDNMVEALKWRVAKDYGVMSDDKLIDYELDGKTAEDVFLIHVDVYSVHLPRGNYYRFTTTKAGAYLIRSWEPNASDYDPNAQDPLGFVCDATGNIIAENDNFMIEAQGTTIINEKERPIYDNNFYMYVYLEANTTYHVAGCFNDPYAMGEYDVTIEYLEDNPDWTGKYFTSCATDPAYTFDENDPNFTPFILPLMGKDRFFIGDDGKYYAQEFDGSQGSVIYIRFIGPTYYNSYSNYTIAELIENDAFDVSVEDKLYLMDLLIQARETYPEDHELYGYVEATEKLVSIINRRANGEDTEESSTYSQTSWLLTAYYYRNVNELTLAQAQAKYNS